MKILHLLYESEGDYFGIGGVCVRAYEIYGRLKERHDVLLLCKKYPGAQDRSLGGLEHVFVGTESTNISRTLLSYACHSAQFVRNHGAGFDVIIEDFSPAIPSFVHAFTKTPVVLQLQALTGLHYFRKYNPASAAVLAALERIRPHFYNNFIAVNGETIRRLHLGSRKRISVIMNGVSPDLVDVDSEDRHDGYILYLGRIDMYSKGLDVLLKAFTVFSREFPSTRLVIAGDGRDRKLFEDTIRKLPDLTKQRIELTGWVSGDRKQDIIRNAVFSVFPSRHEVQGITVLEAMAAGKSVIVSDIPELSYVSSAGSGITFRSGDPDSLYKAMVRLSRSGDRGGMGTRGRDWVRDFTWDRVSLRYEEYLNQVVSSR